MTVDNNVNLGCQENLNNQIERPKSRLEKMPIQLLGRVMSFLPIKDAKAFSSASHALQTASARAWYYQDAAITSALKKANCNFGQIPKPHQSQIRDAAVTINSLKLANFDIHNATQLGLVFTNLLSLDVSSTNISSLALRDAVHYFTKLQTLDISHASKLPEIAFELLKELKELQSLNANGTLATDKALVHIGQLENLEDLKLQQCKINGTGFQHLLPLQKLRKITLNGTQINNQDAIIHLSKLLSLEEIDFCGCKDLPHNALKPLASLPNLKVLDLTGTKANDETVKDLAQCKSLQTVDLGNSPNITALGLKPLQNLKNLTTLYLSGTPINDEALKILEDMPSLKVVTLRRCPNLTQAKIEALKAKRKDLDVRHK